MLCCLCVGFTTNLGLYRREHITERIRTSQTRAKPSKYLETLGSCALKYQGITAAN